MNKEIENQAREIVKEIYKKEHGDNPPEFWVGGKHKISTSEKMKCYKCGKIAYFDRECINLFDEKVKKICVECALKMELTETERRILE